MIQLALSSLDLTLDESRVKQLREYRVGVGARRLVHVRLRDDSKNTKEGE